MMRFLAILTVRNEAAFLLEWLAHHLAVGFTDFLVFSNDCTDGTDLMLDRLDQMGVLVHVRNDGPHPQGPQWAALKAADRHPLMRQADWVLFFDIDEFVNIHVGNRTLPALLEALPDATAIPLTWRFFGNAGVVNFVDACVTETFTKAAPAVLYWPWRAALFKTLFRNDGSYAKLGVHRPRSPGKARLPAQRWFDGAGRELPPPFHTTRIFSDFGQDNYGLVQLNHYALGAMESYVVKCDRGRANRDADSLDMSYWIDRNFCDTEERSILAIKPTVRAHLDALQADARLADLHARGVAWRHGRFTELMKEEAWRGLFGRLLMTPATRVLSSAEAQLVIQHAKRPRKAAASE